VRTRPARLGAIGAGIFVVWPAFFSDITDSYRLSRAGRVRTDLGGIYFNLLLTLPLAGLYTLTGNPLWKWGVVAQFLIVVQQLLPFLRLDGYYLVSDLTGVPDLFGHLRPALRNLLPGRAVDPSFAGLRPGIRFAVTAWAVGTSIFVGWFGWVMALELPRFAAGAGSLLGSLGSSTVSDFAGRRYLLAGAGLVQLVLVAIQVAGVAVVLQRLVRRGIRRPIRPGAERAI
jgi:putative peptide zinc metalloprotease protein